MIPRIFSETGRLREVVLGTAESMGPIPTPEKCYDPKSLESVLNGSYPEEADLMNEMEAFAQILSDNGVKVLRPQVLVDTNQVFARDICFVIENRFIMPNIIADRAHEQDGIELLLEEIDKDHVVRLAPGMFSEGGDFMPWKDHLFIGYSEDEEFKKFKTSRTNRAAVEFITELFPERKIYPIELLKSDTDPLKGILHLDCCFQPIGVDQAIIYPDGMKRKEDVEYINEIFGKDNLIYVDQSEYYQMFPNIFSLDEDTIISNASFARLNKELKERGFTVIETPYDEVSKMGGLLRCSTMPLIRD